MPPAQAHTPKAAGATVTVGPNLDTAKPSRQRVVSRVTNGRCVLVSFEGQLTLHQLEAVAPSVSQAAP